MRKRLLAAAIFLMLFGASALYGADIYYVQSLKAKVMSGPSFKADVVGEALRGHKFSATGRESGWIKVRFGDKEGYVSSLLLAEHPPLEKQGVISGEEAEIKEGARRRASTFVSAAAARGLTAEERKRLSKEEKANYTALDRVESLMLSDDEVIRFVEEGI